MSQINEDLRGQDEILSMPNAPQAESVLAHLREANPEGYEKLQNKIIQYIIDNEIGADIEVQDTWKKYLLFSAGDSNNVVCNKPSDQKFKCMVYKNGEVIRQL